jgi:two-component system OmpR family sensor kinase
MAVVLGLVGIYVYLRVGSDLSSSIDDGLRTRAADLAGQLQGAGPDHLGIGGPHAEGGEDILSEVIGPDGTVLASSEGLSATPALSPPQLSAARQGTVFFSADSVQGIENQARLLARPVQGQSGTFVVLAGASTGDRAETLSGLATAFAVGGLLALLFASALGYGLATLAFRPVETMRRRAGRITLARNGERLPLPASDDEIARLGQTLNEMLARIESSIERERRFVADAGHELRTPLAILRGELELGVRNDRDHGEARAAMRSAIEEADRLQGLADDLLELSRADAAELPLDPAQVDIPELLERLRGRYARRAAGAGRRISIDATPGLAWTVDPKRMETAIGNLVENALVHGTGVVAILAREVDDELELAVQDEGHGLPAGFAARAFDRFARGEAARTSRGTGLGLAIVRAIVTAHGGRVTFDEAWTGGTRAVMRIPAALTEVAPA